MVWFDPTRFEKKKSRDLNIQWPISPRTAYSLSCTIARVSDFLFLDRWSISRWRMKGFSVKGFLVKGFSMKVERFLKALSRSSFLFSFLQVLWGNTPFSGEFTFLVFSSFEGLSMTIKSFNFYVEFQYNNAMFLCHFLISVCVVDELFCANTHYKSMLILWPKSWNDAYYFVFYNDLNFFLFWHSHMQWKFLSFVMDLFDIYGSLG